MILLYIFIVSVAYGAEDCDFELSYRNIALICHTANRPAVRLGHGQFEAVYNLGNYDINDTVLETVGLPQYEILSGNKFTFYNEEQGVGVNLVVYQDEDLGLYEIQFEYPEKYSQGLRRMNRIWLDIVAEPDEYIYGAGEQYSYLNLRGRKYPIWVREQGVGRNKSSLLTQVIDLYSRGGGDYHTTYWPQPSFLSSRRFYFESSYPTYSELDFTQDDRHTLYWHRSTPDGEEGSACRTCHLTFLVKPTLMDIVKALNPGQPPLPSWVYNGAILGVQGGTEKMLEYLDAAKAQGVFISSMWIQDWSGKITTGIGTRVFWNWEWNSTFYPELDNVIKELDEAQNIKVTAYITGHLNIEGEVYKNSSENDYWLKDENGERLIQDFGEFNVGTVDILEPSPECNCINMARNWYKEVMKKNLIDFGFAGWMADFGEYTPTEARSKFADRWWRDDHGEILHQVMPYEWAKLNREVVEEAGKLGDIMFWMRAGGIGSKTKQVMTWAGDQTVDWTRSDGLASSIIAAMSLSLSGMGLTHSDIGGYTTVPQLNVTRSKELFLRWAEYAVFTPIMRTHEGNVPEVNHQFYSDEDTLQQFGRLTRIYNTLSKYTKEVVQQNSEQFVPVMRPMFLMFEDDPEAFQHDYQYMLGDDLLVAPVLDAGVSEWSVYLPEGETWVHLWNAEEFSGGSTQSVPAPLGNPPVFYRKSSTWAEFFAAVGAGYPLTLK